MGLDNLLAAMPTVVEAYPEARLIIAGDGPLREDLRAQARRLGVEERVSFAGFVPEDRLPDYYRAADLVVMPTRALEGFGLTTVEALACGTPVVGTPVGATPEILAPLDPALVTGDATPEAIAAGILRVVASLSGKLRERARAHALARYRWEAVAEGLEAVLREVLR
jgi:glycosyltransferase involved in cell wall biosynthesis